MKTFIDLFCGIGGFHHALKAEGLKCVFSSDIDEKAKAVYLRNFKEKPSGDITKISEKNIPAHDVLCAGFPCQSFSISGSQKGFSDNRGKLFYDIVRIADYCKPSILLLENVKNILSIDNGMVVKTIQSELNNIGYSVYHHLLNSSEYGIPQARERVYFVAIRNDLKLIYTPPKTILKKIYLEDVLDKSPAVSLFVDRDDIEITKEDDIYALKPIRLGQVKKGRQGERIYSVKGHAITLSAFGGGVGARTGLYLTDDGVRKLSIKECKRLMGFPASHIVSPGMEGYKQLGNAVIPAMIRNVYNSIKIYE